MKGYRGKRVLVTGATGFIGESLVLRLQSLGAEVFTVSRRVGTGPVGSPIALQGDLTDAAATKRVFAASNPHLVFHLASEVLGSRDIQYVGTTLQANLVAAVNMLTYAAKYDVERIVLAGSMEEPNDQDDPVVPSSPYAAAKWAATGYARMFHALYGTRAVVAQLFMVYGPGQRDNKKLIPYVITSLLDGATPSLSAGHRPVDWIYVCDVVEGLLACGMTPGIDGQRLALGTGKLTTVREVVETLYGELAPNAAIPFGTTHDRLLETVQVANTDESSELLGWKAATDLSVGLRQTIAWYIERHERNRSLKNQ